MSAPAMTCFCENGHVVYDIPHGSGLYLKPTKCDYCDAEKFAVIFEWGETDYPDGKLVPIKPLTNVWVTVENDDFVGKKKIPVYDVSGVPVERFKIFYKN